MIRCALLIGCAVLMVGCVSSPALPPSGPEQRAAQAVYNPNCVVMCSAKSSQQAADSNTAPVTAGDVKQSSSKSMSGDDL